MSVKELSFEFGVLKGEQVKFTKHGDKIKLEVWGYDGYDSFDLDRNQVHLLMLYLQEHLGYTNMTKEQVEINARRST